MPPPAAVAFQRALAAYGSQQWEAARNHCKQVLKAQPRHADALNLLGLISMQNQDPQRAAEEFARAGKADPKNPESFHNRGVALLHLRQYAAAVASFDAAIERNPDHPHAHFSRGNALLEMHAYAQAVGAFDRALTLDPRNTAALHNRGLALLHLKQHGAALTDLDRALELAPEYASAHLNRGNALVGIENYAAAIMSFDRALALDPGCVDAYNNRAIACTALGEHEAAVDFLSRAIELRPDNADAFFNRGNALLALRRYGAAIADYDAALGLRTGWADALLNRGNALYETLSYEAAVRSYDAALEQAPESARAYENRGIALRALGRYAEAISSFERAIALRAGSGAPAGPASGMRLHLKLQLCDWRGFDEDLGHIIAAVERREFATTPMCMLALSGSARLQRLAAECWVRAQGFARNAPARLDLDSPPLGSQQPLGLDAASRPNPAKIRLGYFSADFREHAVARLIAEAIEHHDRSRFEVMAFSFGPEAEDDMRRRLVHAFDRFIDVRSSSDRQIAELSRGLGVDIAVDLGGFTEMSRPRIFALRAAPIQLSYLGYLGTLGAGYMDYLIADSTIIPAASREFYAEKIIYLPSYQANDSKRPVAERTFSRVELGLPAKGFVFCCFNANYKMNPALFASWMRILEAVEGSVLFLYAGGATAEANLIKEAIQQGIDPGRLVFGGALPAPDYRARFRTADLFLDTSPYNAGTTASDALWSGLPVLTCPGESFASRVAASLLRALELPELIATDRADYERRAIDLASNPARLAGLNRELRSKLRFAPLFDTARFTRTLESAYIAVRSRHAAGLPPDHIHIDGGVP
jgi:predicted O-linked N-acetylglucosamine transferase (SPINDLY family)